MAIALAKIVQARDTAVAGVDYSPRYGALCPWCGKRTKVVNTQPWYDGLRVRYHRCQGSSCTLAGMGISIKSIEVDYSGG